MRSLHHNTARCQVQLLPETGIFHDQGRTHGHPDPSKLQQFMGGTPGITFGHIEYQVTIGLDPYISRHITVSDRHRPAVVLAGTVPDNIISVDGVTHLYRGQLCLGTHPRPHPSQQENQTGYSISYFHLLIPF